MGGSSSRGKLLSGYQKVAGLIPGLKTPHNPNCSWHVCCCLAWLALLCLNGWMWVNCKALWIKALYTYYPFTIYKCGLVWSKTGNQSHQKWMTKAVVNTAAVIPMVPWFQWISARQLTPDSMLSFSPSEQLMQLYCARQRRRLNRGLRRKQQSLLKRLRKAKKEAPPMEKPEVVKTHLRDMVILPEMVGSMVGVYNGKTFNQVEIKVRLQMMGVCCCRVVPFLCFVARGWENAFYAGMQSWLAHL